nr:SipW-dependent-type signal peptide-containing protein [Clostridia bacterium]
MKTLKLRKILLTITCAMLLVALTVGATFAYLTSQDTVTNTFTVGNVAITLDETDVDTAGVKDGDTRVKANTYHLLPGHTYIKDPVVHIDANSENCWIFVEITNEIAPIEDATTIHDQMVAKGWTLLPGSTNVYAYKEIVGKSMNIPVFDQVKVKDDVDNTTLADYANKTVEVVAYAVQADGFGSAAAAWNATFGASTDGE